MQDSLNYDGLKHFYLLSSQLNELNNLKGKSGSIATIVDTGAEYMYEESSNQWHLQPSSGGGGITPEQLAAYIKDYAIKNEPSTPSTDSYSVGNVIFDQTDGKIKLCGLNTSDEKVWIDVTAVWLGMYKTTVLDESYPSKSDVILITNQLPLASEEFLGKFYLLRTDNKIYRCENTGTIQSPIYGWVEKICLAIDELPSSDIPQTLDNDKKFYLTEEAVTKDGQVVTDYQWFKLTDNGKRKGYDVSAEGLTVPGGTTLAWEEVTLNNWQSFITLNYFVASSQKEADVITGYINDTWFVTYIGNVNVTSPKLLYEDKNGVQVVVNLNTLQQMLQNYQPKITAGAGLVFDGNTLKHSNSVTPKPQRYIRATAYDAQGHAINFGVDYLVARADYNDEFISDLYLTSSLWVHKHHSPIEASSFASASSGTPSADDRVFNMENIGDSTLTRRSQKRYMGLASITNPIDDTTTLYGGIDVTECWYTYTQEGTGICTIEQVFKNSYIGSNGIVFKRFGSLNFATAGEYGTAIYTNRASIVWENWFPVEYPVTVFTSNNPDFNITSMSFYVSGGIVNIFINELTQLVASPASNIIATLPSCLKCKNGVGAHGMLINSDNFNSFATLSEIASNNILKFRGGGTAGKYYGNLSYGIGY